MPTLMSCLPQDESNSGFWSVSAEGFQFSFRELWGIEGDSSWRQAPGVGTS